MKKRLIIATLILTIPFTSFANPSPVYDINTGGGSVESTKEKTFNDVDKAEWYANSVQWATTKNIVTGYEDGSFKPDKEVTEAEFVVFLLRTAKNVDTSTFIVDKSGSHWANRYYKEAEEMDLPFMGYDDLLKRSASITRGQVAQLIAAKNGFYLDLEEAVDYMYQNKLSSGMNNIMNYENYGAQLPMTRAQATAFMKRISEAGITEYKERKSPVTGSDLFGVVDPIYVSSSILEIKQVEKPKDEIFLRTYSLERISLAREGQTLIIKVKNGGEWSDKVAIRGYFENELNAVELINLMDNEGIGGRSYSIKDLLERQEQIENTENTKEALINVAVSKNNLEFKNSFLNSKHQLLMTNKKSNTTTSLLSENYCYSALVDVLGNVGFVYATFVDIENCVTNNEDFFEVFRNDIYLLNLETGEFLESFEDISQFNVLDEERFSVTNKDNSSNLYTYSNNKLEKEIVSANLGMYYFKDGDKEFIVQESTTKNGLLNYGLHSRYYRDIYVKEVDWDSSDLLSEVENVKDVANIERVQDHLIIQTSDGKMTSLFGKLDNDLSFMQEYNLNTVPLVTDGERLFFNKTGYENIYYYDMGTGETKKSTIKGNVYYVYDDLNEKNLVYFHNYNEYSLPLNMVVKE